jgi:peptidoglycan/LPS O-acetylase OafA/YrhL
MTSSFTKRDSGGSVASNATTNVPMQYNSAIDGLRAIAVALVLAYHLDVGFMSGGFVGVDIFFVISGYLMTSRIAQSVEAGDFNYYDYLGRRIRRLLPAAATVTFTSCLVAVSIFPPAEIKSVLRSAIYTFFGLSNLSFWSQTGYFDQAAIMKPLLHTWSLAVEFQFYLVLPAATFAFLKLTRALNRIAIGLALISIGVLVSAAWLQLDPPGAYLLTPARAFEFGIGAAAASLGATKVGPRIAALSLMGGLITIASCAVLFSESLPFPGISALVPTCGAALVLYSIESPVAASLIGNQPLRSLGKISYSVYLVHWPLIVFATFYLDLLEPIDKAFVVTATLGLSLLLYRCVEQPFRRSSSNSQKKLVARATFTAMLTTTGLLFLLGNSAWTWRYNSELVKFIDPKLKKPAQDATWSLIREAEKPFSDNRNPKILIIGDSQAGDFTNIIHDAYGPTVEVRSIISSSPCQILTSSNYYRDFAPTFIKKCTAFSSKLLADPRLTKADTIILAFNWYLESAAFVDADAAILKARGAQRVFVVGAKEIGTDPMKLAAKQGSMNQLGENIWKRIPEKLFQTNAALSKAASNFRYLDILEILCPPMSRRCLMVADDGAPVFYDHVHITLSGATLVSKSKAIGEMHLDKKFTHIANR